MSSESNNVRVDEPNRGQVLGFPNPNRRSKKQPENLSRDEWEQATLPTTVRRGSLNILGRDPAKFASIVVIHVEQFDGAAADRSQADDPISFDSEMLAPFLQARMKQRDELAVDVRGQIWSLEKIAPMARETEIGFVVRAVMLPGDDVIDVERDEGQVVLVTATVFTAITRSLTDETAE